MAVWTDFSSSHWSPLTALSVMIIGHFRNVRVGLKSATKKAQLFSKSGPEFASFLNMQKNKRFAGASNQFIAYALKTLNWVTLQNLSNGVKRLGDVLSHQHNAYHLALIGR